MSKYPEFKPLDRIQRTRLYDLRSPQATVVAVSEEKIEILWDDTSSGLSITYPKDEFNQVYEPIRICNPQ